MKVVGLTGGIATGKSTVGRLLRERGVPVIDADQVSRDVVAPGSPGLAKVVDRFGRDVLLPDGSLDRGKLRAIVVRDAEARKDLESITHPAIREAIGRHLAELAASGAPVAVVEAALMVETGSWKLYDALIVVSCAPETQLRRLVGRDGHPEPEARAMIATQLPMAEKEKVATVVIRNDRGLDELAMQLWAAWRWLPAAELHLAPASLAWAERHLPGRAERHDLARTYRFDHALNGSATLSQQEPRESPTPRFRWAVRLRAPDGDELLLADHPEIVRAVFPNARTWSRDGAGPVAYNALLYWNPKYRRHGLSSALYAAEEDLYRRWGVREIQIQADEDGPIVWVKKFGFKPKDWAAVRRDFVSWARRRGADPNPPDDPAHLPDDFLRDRRSLLVYKDLT